VPQLGGDLLLKAYEKQCLWLGGTSDSRPQLVIFIKDKCYLCGCIFYCVLVYLCLTWVKLLYVVAYKYLFLSCLMMLAPISMMHIACICRYAWI
jgi:hypothetical protein